MLFLFAIEINTWKNEECLSLLSHPLVDIQSMKDHLQKENKIAEFSNNVYLCELENGIKGVFKPLEKDCNDPYCEVVAYNISCYLGFPDIPPTIMKKIVLDEKIIEGSFQLFVDTNIDSLKLSDEDYKSYMEKDIFYLQDILLWCFIFGQWDTGPHNTLFIGDNNHPVLIDNSGIANEIYAEYGKPAFVKHIEVHDCNIQRKINDEFPFDKAEIVPGKKHQKYVIYNGYKYIQYHFNDESFIIHAAKFCKKSTYEKLKGIDFGIVQKLYTVNGKQVITDGQIHMILRRRDIALNNLNNYTGKIT